MIRKAQDKDIPRLLELLVQVDMVHHNGRPDIFKGPAVKYSAEQLRAILRDSSAPVFVYTDEDDAALAHAFCLFRQIVGDPVMTDVKSLYIDDICVDETARGQHIGRALYDYIVAYAAEHGCYNVTLNVWTCNPAAMKFYESMGMTPQRIVMEKIL